MISTMAARDAGAWWALAAMLLLLGDIMWVRDAPARDARAYGWDQPWTEPEDAVAAARRSDEYAWRLFVALNWPADPLARTADRYAPLGADRPVVWETWRNAREVYLANGLDPGPWASGEPETQSGTVTAQRFESVIAPDRRNVRHIVGGVMVPLLDPMASAKRLTEIRMNRPAFEFIRARELYNVEGQLRAYADARPLSFPYGAKDVKARWRPIGAGERSRYHTVVVTRADGSTQLYGLTALHIAAKDLPTWFWATFEHVDNPTLDDNEGWELPSRDGFACRHQRVDCNRAPRGIGLEGTVWQYYRLRGTLTRYTGRAGQPQLLANSELEAGMQHSASCITCHARAALGVLGGEARRLAVFDDRSDESAATAIRRRGFVGEPHAEWFIDTASAHAGSFRQLDFVWSLAQAQHRAP